MTGDELVKLMRDPAMKHAVYKAARRHTRSIEDIEEYMDDAWMRIADCDSGKDEEYYATQAFRAINAAYMRKRYVEGKKPHFLNGNSKKGIEKPPRDSIELGRGRYLLIKHDKLKTDSGKPVNPPYHRIVVVQREAK